MQFWIGKKDKNDKDKMRKTQEKCVIYIKKLVALLLINILFTILLLFLCCPTSFLMRLGLLKQASRFSAMLFLRTDKTVV